MIKLHFEKLSAFDRIKEPCSVGIPFKEGMVLNVNSLSITDGKDLVKSQAIATAFHQDGSVKWAFVDFEADLPANNEKNYYCKIEKDCDSSEKINIYKEEDKLVINNGKLLIKLNEKGSIFNLIKYDDIVYGQDEIEGPVINKEFCARIEKGWEIVRNGEVTALVQAKGKHFDAKNNGVIDFIVTIQVFNNKDWFKIDYKIINCEEADEFLLSSAEINFNKKPFGKPRLTAGKSNYRTTFTTDEKSIYQGIDAQDLLYEANEHFPEVFFGTFFADWCDEKGGICATIYQAQQNFPKAFEVLEDKISIQLVPEKCEGIKFLQGMAKTQTVFLHLHGADVSKEELNIRSLQFQLPDRPLIESSVYEEANVFADIFLEDSKKDYEVEMAFIRKMDIRGKAYGMLHFGDAPDSGYTEQGRGNGELVWCNNEYDFPHTAMLMYARTPMRRYLDYLLVAARHWMDIDVCHYSTDKYRMGGQIIHSAKHISGKAEISHEWVEGLFDYYHMTGDKYAYDCAIEIGKNVKLNLTLPKYHKKGEINARETGWALRTLVAVYIETNDEYWLEEAEFIIGHFESWKERYGEWLAPYTDHTVIRVPFMISIAVASLMRYYNIRPEEKIKKMILDAVDDMVDNCVLDNGLFYYKELPSLSRLGNNTTVLEALTYAFNFTKDKKYIEAGRKTFQNYVNDPAHGNYVSGKKIFGDAVVISSNSPKGIAQSFFPVVNYYVTAQRAGIELF